jgi:hypothetical protein
MKKLYILFLMIGGLLGAELPPEEIQAQKEGLEKWRGIAIQAPNMPKEEAILKLSEGLRKTSRSNMYSIEGTQEVNRLLRDKLLAIPGHAKYYQQKIEKMRSDLLEISKKNPLEVIKMQQEGMEVIDEPNYLSDTESALRTLEYMPSAETVSVLGHFLNDPEGRDGKTLLGNPRHRPGDDFPPRASNAEVATDVIRELGIEHPPFKERGTITAEEIDAWKDWWNEVTAGKRTYRFIGSNIEYGPDGPASKEATQRADRNQKRDAERAAGHIKSEPARSATASAGNTKANSGSIVSIAAALVVLLSIAGFLARKKMMGRA